MLFPHQRARAHTLGFLAGMCFRLAEQQDDARYRRDWATFHAARVAWTERLAELRSRLRVWED